MGGVHHSSHEDEAVGAVLVDEEEEGPVHDETGLGGQRHEADLGQRRRLCALLVHRDGALVPQLPNDTDGE